MYDQNEKTGSLIVYPQTHLRFTELTNITHTSNDFVMIRGKHSIIDDGKTRGKLVHCKAGDLILWDSRTVHCNSPAVAIDKLEQGESIDLLRLVVYVSMSPIQFIRNFTLEEFREKRKYFVENNITTNHWGTELIAAGMMIDFIRSTSQYLANFLFVLGEEHTGLPALSIDNFTDYQKALIFGFEDKDTE